MIFLVGCALDGGSGMTMSRLECGYFSSKLSRRVVAIGFARCLKDFKDDESL